MLGSDLLCLAHEDSVEDISGRIVQLHPGMTITAFDNDAGEDGNPDKILATGVVEKSPNYAQCRGSKWALRINEAGIQWESELK